MRTTPDVGDIFIAIGRHCSLDLLTITNAENMDQEEGEGKYVHNGDSVGVVMDTTSGELSFSLDGVDLGVAYEGIPLDKPLVPCVLLYYRYDSVELVI